MYNVLDNGQITLSPVVSALGANLRHKNLVPLLTDEKLQRASADVFDGFRVDKDSRLDWEKTCEKATSLAMLAYETKTRHGVAVANMKLPLVAVAVIQFGARALPNVVKNAAVAKCRVIGSDPNGLKSARGVRVSTCLNHQFLYEMRNWKEDTDFLLHLLPLVGSCFRKTYYDQIERRPVSVLAIPKDLVVNFWAKSIEDAERVSHIVTLSPNQIESRIRSGLFVPFNYGSAAPPGSDIVSSGDKSKDIDPSDRRAPHTFIEQHCWMDLDDDGYAEPYVAIGHENSKKIVRILPRYDWDGVWWNEDGGLVKIDATNHFTHYRFLPSLDGGFYGMGFGSLLLHGNEFSNTLFNQIVDAGTKSNLGGGFLGAGVKVPSGTHILKDGEWKVIPYVGDNLRNNIVPTPDKGPSQVSFNALELLLGLMEKLASQSDIMSGANPPRDQPATTTLALLEQGMKVFVRVFSRINDSIADEFGKVMSLNFKHLDDEGYQTITDDPMSIVQIDFNKADKDVCPISEGEDPTDTQRLLKSEALLQFVNPYNEREIMRRRLEAIGIADVDKIVPPDDWQPPPDPELELKMKELELREREVAILERKSTQELLKIRADAVLALAKAEAAEAGVQNDIYNQQLESLRLQIDAADAILKGVNDGAAGQGSPGNGGAVPPVEVGPGDAMVPGDVGAVGGAGAVPIPGDVVPVGPGEGGAQFGA